MLAFSVADRRAGLPVLYLGPDVPLEDWVGAARRTGAAAAVIGAVTTGDGRAAAAVAAALETAGLRTLVAVGGRGAGAASAVAGAAIVLPARLRDGVETPAAALERVAPG